MIIARIPGFYLAEQHKGIKPESVPQTLLVMRARKAPCVLLHQD